MTDPTPLHRLFGLSWFDYLQGTDVTVETEVDLSLKQQFLDLILIRKGTKPIRRPLPDGFERLTSYNLVTFKSHQEALDGWSLCELIGHYVNYRKQVSPARQDLLPAKDFRLFAVCVRRPRKLIQSGALQPVRAGVYDAEITGLLAIRVIVIHELPAADHNAMLHLFSANASQVRYGSEHHGPQSMETSSLILRLFWAYWDDPHMSPNLKKFARESIKEILKELPPQERLEGMTPQERLKGMPAEERLRGIPPKERLEGIPPKERLEGLTADELQQLLAEGEQRLKDLKRSR